VQNYIPIDKESLQCLHKSMDLKIYNDYGGYLQRLFQKSVIATLMENNIVVLNVKDKDLSQEIIAELNRRIREIENVSHLEKNSLMWELQNNNLIIKRRARLRDAYIKPRRITMQGNDNYKKIDYIVMSKEDNICKEFGSIAEAEDFIKEHKDRLIN
jgi:hypothetical protein